MVRSVWRPFGDTLTKLRFCQCPLCARAQASFGHCGSRGLAHGMDEDQGFASLLSVSYGRSGRLTVILARPAERGRAHGSSVTVENMWQLDGLSLESMHGKPPERSLSASACARPSRGPHVTGSSPFKMLCKTPSSVQEDGHGSWKQICCYSRRDHAQRMRGSSAWHPSAKEYPKGTPGFATLAIGSCRNWLILPAEQRPTCCLRWFSISYFERPVGVDQVIVQRCRPSELWQIRCEFSGNDVIPVLSKELRTSDVAPSGLDEMLLGDPVTYPRIPPAVVAFQG